MTSVRILDHYRESIIYDQENYKIISSIFKSGIESEENLSKKYRLSVNKVRMSLARLYKANMVKLIGSGDWTLTPISESILAKLGVHEAYSKSLITNSLMNQKDIVILMHYITQESKVNEEWCNDLSLNLRHAFFICKELNVDLSLLTRATYALAAGTNQHVYGIDLDIYLNDWLLKKENNWFNSEMDKWDIGREFLRMRFKKGLEDFNYNNEMLLLGKANDDISSYIVMLSRFFSNAVALRDSCNLYPIYRLDNKVYSNGWGLLKNWEPNLENKFSKFPYYQRFFEKKNKIVYLLEESAAKQNDLVISNEMERVQELTIEDAIDKIDSISTGLIRGDLNDVSQSSKNELISKLETAHEIAKSILMVKL